MSCWMVGPADPALDPAADAASGGLVGSGKATLRVTGRAAGSDTLACSAVGRPACGGMAAMSRTPGVFCWGTIVTSEVDHLCAHARRTKNEGVTKLTVSATAASRRDGWRALPACCGRGEDVGLRGEPGCRSREAGDTRTCSLGNRSSGVRRERSGMIVGPTRGCYLIWTSEIPPLEPPVADSGEGECGRQQNRDVADRRRVAGDYRERRVVMEGRDPGDRAHHRPAD